MCTAGYILAGGRSSRMGRDKGLLPFGGVTLIQHIGEQVTAAAGSATIVGNPDLYRHLGIRAIADLYPHEGPMGGLVTALSHTDALWNLVVACDLPKLNSAFLMGLLQAAVQSRALCLIPKTADGQEHPLCGVYHRDACRILSEELKQGQRTVRRAIRLLAPQWVELPDLNQLLNVNTQGEWAAYQTHR